jgi:hypothetical protein
MRGEDAGLDEILADGWSRKMVCDACGEGGRLNGIGCCLRGDSCDDSGRIDPLDCWLSIFFLPLHEFRSLLSRGTSAWTRVAQGVSFAMGLDKCSVG